MTDVWLYLSAPGVLPSGPSDAPRAWMDWLSSPERVRLEGFGHAGAAAEFLTGRAMLRTCLSAHHPALAPADWAFEFNARGCPRVASSLGDVACAWHFNLSHTRGLVAVALARVPVGVDVETSARGTDTDRVAHRYFAPAELAAMRAITDAAERRQRFFDWWTLKEAYIKVRGAGLAIPLRDFAWSIVGETLGLEFAPGHDRADPEHFAAAIWNIGAAERCALCVDCSESLDDVEVFARWWHGSGRISDLRIRPRVLRRVRPHRRAPA